LSACLNDDCPCGRYEDAMYAGIANMCEGADMFF